MRNEIEMDVSRQSRSLGSLFSALSRQLSALFRRELALARAELAEKVREAGSGLALLAVGGMIILIGLFFIAQAVVFGWSPCSTSGCRRSSRYGSGLCWSASPRC
jgi:hypothetical protein